MANEFSPQAQQLPQKSSTTGNTGVDITVTTSYKQPSQVTPDGNSATPHVENDSQHLLLPNDVTPDTSRRQQEPPILDTTPHAQDNEENPSHDDTLPHSPSNSLPKRRRLQLPHSTLQVNPKVK